MLIPQYWQPRLLISGANAAKFSSRDARRFEPIPGS
jgi:hypothetical protein